MTEQHNLEMAAQVIAAGANVGQETNYEDPLSTKAWNWRELINSDGEPNIKEVRKAVGVAQRVDLKPKNKEVLQTSWKLLDRRHRELVKGQRFAR